MYRLHTEIAAWWLYLRESEIVPEIAILQHREAQDVLGGTFPNGSYIVRPITHKAVDTLGSVVLASNQFTLPAGYTCLIMAEAEGYRVNRHQCIVYDVTNAAYFEPGTLAFANNTANTGALSRASAWCDLLVPTTFEIHGQCQTTVNNEGLGRSSTWGESKLMEVVVFLWQK